MLDITNFPWSEVIISENRSLYVQDTLGLSRKKRDQKKHRYEFEMTTIDMDMKQGKSVVAKLSSAYDDYLTFVHPRLSYSYGTIPAAPITVNRAASVGSRELYVFCSQTYELVIGDYLNISGTTKVYQIGDTEVSGETVGEMLITLTSPLLSDIQTGVSLKFNDVEWRLVSDGKIEYEMVASDNQDIPFTLIAVEKI